ncbi:MAG: methionyl-tRNA formyltransferase [Oscillospiraceae bacterium]|nr:methionyl-tRNA formyltransferase [Oscillospiraceae bacterium]
MRVVFMGTPAFAVPCLERLAADGHDIPAVFCQPDRPQGRRMQLAPPPVKQAALAHGLPVMQPEKLRRNPEMLALLRSLAPELIVVVAYGQILPQALLDIPKHGCINVHASLLPKYRGAAPIQWAILNGETETGVTTMQMDAGIDTGDILLQAKTPIPEDMNAGELHDVLSALGAQVLSDTINLLGQGKLVPQKQDNTQATHAPMLSKELSPLDFAKPAQELHNRVRGLNPWPGASMEFHERLLKVHKTRVAEQGGSPLCVPCGDGKFLELLTVQAEGKKAMAAEEYIRGIRRK